MLTLNANATEPREVTKTDVAFAATGFRLPGLRHTVSVCITDGHARIEYANRLPLILLTNDAKKAHITLMTWANRIRKEEAADAKRMADNTIKALTTAAVYAINDRIKRRELESELVELRDRIDKFRDNADVLSKSHVRMLQGRISCLVWQLDERANTRKSPSYS